MKKVISIVMLMFFIGAVQAETSGTGVVTSIDLEYGNIVIDKIKYQIKPGETQLLSGRLGLDLSYLEEGALVDFEFENSLISEISFVTPIKINE